MTGRLRHVVREGGRPVPVTATALVVVFVVAATGMVVSEPGWAAAVALVLVVPVVGAAVLGGRVPGYLNAAAAAVALTPWLSPTGSLRVAVAQDLVALAVFAGVAVAMSTLATRRIDALAEVDRQRSLLLRSVSHDLRTPLATIRGVATELLDGADHDEDTRRRLLRLVDLEAGRLDRLVANLLALGRIESGAAEPRPTVVDLGTLVDEALTRRRLGPDTERVRWESEATSTPVLAWADPAQVDLVLANLLDNAQRHSPDGGTVTVARRTTETGSVQLSVNDEGPGVPPAERELVFRPFRSGDLPGSNGVGLAVSRALVEGHGGTIHVTESTAGGARFTVELPGAAGRPSFDGGGR